MAGKSTGISILEWAVPKQILFCRIKFARKSFVRQTFSLQINDKDSVLSKKVYELVQNSASDISVSVNTNPIF